MEKIRVHYTDILSITDGRLASKDGMDGIYRIMDALAGPGVTTIALLYLQPRMKDHLLKTYPIYATKEVQEATAAAYFQWQLLTDGMDKKDERTGDLLNEQLDKYVLPLLSSEWEEVKHVSDSQQEELLDAYPSFLEDKLKDKKVILVELSEKE